MLIVDAVNQVMCRHRDVHCCVTVNGQEVRLNGKDVEMRSHFVDNDPGLLSKMLAYWDDYLKKAADVIHARLTEDDQPRNVRAALLALLRDRCVKRGIFTLASGETSSYYIDCRLLTVSGAGIELIGKAICHATRDLSFAAIGGMETGAIPLTVAAINAHERGDLEGFWVRRASKDHGTKKRIEGNLLPGVKVLIVEDVATSGASLLDAVTAVREQGCEVVGVCVLVDRLQGAADAIKNAGIAVYRPVLTVADLGGILTLADLGV